MLATLPIASLLSTVVYVAGWVVLWHYMDKYLDWMDQNFSNLDNYLDYLRNWMSESKLTVQLMLQYYWNKCFGTENETAYFEVPS